jgi:hypothetical protein
MEGIMIIEKAAGPKPAQAISADKERDFEQIENAWRFYDENDKRIYYSNLFREYEKRNISVKADADANSVTAKASLETSVSRISTEAVISLDFKADLNNVKARLDEDCDLVIAVPKRITAVNVE